MRARNLEIRFQKLAAQLVGALIEATARAIFEQVEVDGRVDERCCLIYAIIVVVYHRAQIGSLLHANLSLLARRRQRKN